MLWDYCTFSRVEFEILRILRTNWKELAVYNTGCRKSCNISFHAALHPPS